LAAEARNAADEAQAQAAELEAELQAARWDKDELAQRFQGMQQGEASADVARLRDEVAQRSAKLVEQEREIARLEAVVAEFTSQPSTGIAPAPPFDADREHLRELERRVEEAEHRRDDAERRAAEAEARAAENPGAEAAADRARSMERLKSERDSLQAQVVERDARLARMQREVVDKTDRLGRLAKEMGELKAKGIGKLFK
ncbi:MAG: methyltransferase type 11, partial [Anaeromyxobacteraceae bacterium]